MPKCFIDPKKRDKERGRERDRERDGERDRERIFTRFDFLYFQV